MNVDNTYRRNNGIILNALHYENENESESESDGELPSLFNNSYNISESQIINNSFYQENPYKNVFDIENNRYLLKHSCYDKNAHKNSSCPIYMVDFEDEDEVVELPCGHCFIPEAIYEWLEKQSNCCPFCRYELPSKEIKVEQKDTTETEIYPNRPLNAFDTANIQNNQILLEMLVGMLNENAF